MTPERWSKVKEAFLGAVERRQDERAAFLERACGADADLRTEVESLVEFDVPPEGDELLPPGNPDRARAVR